MTINYEKSPDVTAAGENEALAERCKPAQVAAVVISIGRFLTAKHPKYAKI
jgi:hypothetical protein